MHRFDHLHIQITIYIYDLFVIILLYFALMDKLGGFHTYLNAQAENT